MQHAPTRSVDVDTIAHVNRDSAEMDSRVQISMNAMIFTNVAGMRRVLIHKDHSNVLVKMDSLETVKRVLPSTSLTHASYTNIIVTRMQPAPIGSVDVDLIALVTKDSQETVQRVMQ